MLLMVLMLFTAIACNSKGDGKPKSEELSLQKSEELSLEELSKKLSEDLNKNYETYTCRKGNFKVTLFDGHYGPKGCKSCGERQEIPYANSPEEINLPYYEIPERKPDSSIVANIAKSAIGYKGDLVPRHITKQVLSAIAKVNPKKGEYVSGKFHILRYHNDPENMALEDDQITKRYEANKEKIFKATFSSSCGTAERKEHKKTGSSSKSKPRKAMRFAF